MNHANPESIEIENMARKRGFWPTLGEHPYFGRIMQLFEQGKRKQADRLQQAALEEIQSEASILNDADRRHFTEQNRS